MQHRQVLLHNRIAVSGGFTHLYSNARAVIPHTPDEEVSNGVNIPLLHHILRNEIEVSNH